LPNLRENSGNALYPAALKLRPDLADYPEILNRTRPALAQMSGSGPAFFAFYADIQARDTAFTLLKHQYEVYSVETTPCSQTVLEN